MPALEKTDHQPQHGQLRVDARQLVVTVSINSVRVWSVVSFGFGGLILVFTLRHGLFCNRPKQQHSCRLSYNFTEKIAGGLEYYGSLGPATEFYPLNRQHHQFFPSVDLDLSPKWEMNFGVGWDPNHSSDHIIVKFILGRRFSWGGERDLDNNEPERK